MPWEANINSHIKDADCPFCTGQKPSKANCLATKNPSLSKQWHPTKNKPLTPNDVTYGAGKIYNGNT